MTEPGFKGLTMKKELWDALQKEYAKQYPNPRLRPSFAAWVSDILWKALEKK